MSDKLTNMAMQILYIEQDLPSRFDYDRDEEASVNDFDISIFDQIWGSTALGFPGVGGQAVTEATTFVFIPVGCDQDCFVYFDGRFAYSVPYSHAFLSDVKGHCMESVMTSGKYRRAAREELQQDDKG